MKRALIVVDCQKDFVEGGRLAVTGGKMAARRAGLYARTMKERGRYDLIVVSRDWHDDWSHNGGHFSHVPDYADTWPIHCVAGSTGAEFASELYAPGEVSLGRAPGKPPWADIEVLKGQGKPAYSAFEGTVPSSGYGQATLDDVMRELGVTDMDVCGIALDYCVRATALSGVDRGIDTSILLNLTAAVDWPRATWAMTAMVQQGVRFPDENFLVMQDLEAAVLD